MLCCGVVSLLAAAALMLWRRMATIPWAFAACAAGALLAGPALAIVLADHSHLTRAEWRAYGLQAFCGAP